MNYTEKRIGMQNTEEEPLAELVNEVSSSGVDTRALEKRPCLLDGSAGTALWAMAEAAGVERKSVWMYNIEHPEFVLELHRRYVEAGCRMIQANTFSINRQSVARESAYSVEEVVTAAVRLAKQATEGTGVQVYATFGPLLQLMEPYGRLSEAEVYDIYSELAETALREGADLIVLETFMDIRMMEVAARAAKRFGKPVICSMTFERRHRTMMGDTVKKIVETLEPLGIDGVGMNCSAGPVEALGIIKEFSQLTKLPLYFKPNAGMGENYSAKQFAQEIDPALPLVSFVGGCCGCDEEYIKEIRKLL